MIGRVADVMAKTHLKEKTISKLIFYKMAIFLLTEEGLCTSTVR